MHAVLYIHRHLVVTFLSTYDKLSSVCIPLLVLPHLWHKKVVAMFLDYHVTIHPLDCTVVHKCLSLLIPSQIHTCTLYFTAAVPRTGFSYIRVSYIRGAFTLYGLLIFFSGMEADRNVKVVGGDMALL